MTTTTDHGLPSDADLAELLWNAPSSSCFNPRTLDIFVSLLQGGTLEMVGQKHNIGKERVRQIFAFTHHALSRRLKLKEVSHHYPGLNQLREDPQKSYWLFIGRRLQEITAGDIDAFIEQRRRAPQLSLEIQEFLLKPLYWLDVSVRACNALKQCVPFGEKATIGDVLKFTKEELKDFPNLGEKSLKEVLAELKKLGLKLRGE